MQRPRFVPTGMLLLLSSLALTACAAERPEVASGPSDWSVAEDDTPLDAGEEGDGGAAPEAPPTRCTPGEGRACKQTYYDADGRKHCPTSTQYCRADGLGWLACGSPPEPLSAVDGDPER
ncbi:MAG: hypothetical protein KF795_14595 [Labilithrix sp.]|nr:hypothetical protein [Labilithrix sp.]